MWFVVALLRRNRIDDVDERLLLGLETLRVVLADVLHGPVLPVGTHDIRFVAALLSGPWTLKLLADLWLWAVPVRAPSREPRISVLPQCD